MADPIWRDVLGYEGHYEVSNLGEVRSVDRLRPYRGEMRPLRGRTLKPWFSKYWNVRLSLDGEAASRSVHSLVAEAFLGPRPDDMEVCHNNGDVNDNRSVNLRYDTHSNNQRDQVKHGTNPFAKRTHCPRGHEYTPENTAYFPSDPRARKCRECIRLHNEKLMTARRSQ